MDAELSHTLETLVVSDENSFINPSGSTITFHSLNYTLSQQKCCTICPLPCMKKKHKRILYDINGIFKPGMNAILGPTGSGKSSLLDILADRKDRKGLQGQVLMDGQNQTDDFKYRVGYVVQDDIVSGTLTVRENLTFSANLRLSKHISQEQKRIIIHQVIGQLGLEKCADSKVGTEFSRGISGGERKRTNIGMELVLSPSVLFLDEPTTGLDSSTARNVMEYLHQLSRRGRMLS
jgi:ATP-binding cassette subfamily G (WHITE) protein 2